MRTSDKDERGGFLANDKKMNCNTELSKAKKKKLERSNHTLSCSKQQRIAVGPQLK